MKKNSIFYNKKKKPLIERLKKYDKEHKVPNWISALIVMTTVYLIIKITLWFFNR